MLCCWFFPPENKEFGAHYPTNPLSFVPTDHSLRTEVYSVSLQEVKINSNDVKTPKNKTPIWLNKSFNVSLSSLPTRQQMIHTKIVKLRPNLILVCSIHLKTACPASHTQNRPKLQFGTKQMLRGKKPRGIGRVGTSPHYISAQGI